MKEIELIKRQLSKNNIKMTTQRRAVIECFLSNRNRHMTAEEIYFLVNEKRPETGLATVYRALDLFEKYDVIKKIKDERSAVYELKQYSKKSTHFHIKCKNCGNLIDVVDRAFELQILNFKQELEKKYDCIIEDVEIIMGGICSDCRKAL